MILMDKSPIKRILELFKIIVFFLCASIKVMDTSKENNADKTTFENFTVRYIIIFKCN